MKKVHLFLFLIYHLIFTQAMSHEVTTQSFDHLHLYPIVASYEEGYLQVSDFHRIYYAQFGNPNGIPVLIVHGGPGAGCSDKWTSAIDVSFYRVIMFDQRGAKRSTPFADMRENTPQKSVEDMEVLRKHLKIDQWLLFGGSWGTALSILYGETHPDRCLGFVLRGIFLARQQDYENLFHGMKRTFPEAWEEMVQCIPEDERDNLMFALHKRVMDPDPQIHLPVAHAFMRYDIICGNLLPNPEMIGEQALNNESALTTARAFIHYSVNHFFLEDNQLLNNIEKINHLPAIMVHGRYDMICLPQSAYELSKKWPQSRLWFIPNAGHFYAEPAIARGLRAAMDEMKNIIQIQ